MSRELESLIADICASDPDRVGAALQAASPHRDALTPSLLAHLALAAAVPAQWTESDDRQSPIFLCYLAAEWKLTEAHLLIVALLRLPAEQCDEMLGDFITEGAKLALADTWPGETLRKSTTGISSPRRKKMTKCRSMGPWHRTTMFPSIASP